MSFISYLINGISLGSIYAIIALGYTMVYGIIRMINFAHGDFIMIGAYTLFYTIPLMVDAGMPAWMAVIVAVAVCALVALITALAMSIFLENLAMVLFGAKPHNVQAIFSLPTITVGGVSLPLNVLLTIGIGVAMMLCMQLFVKKTKLGKAMRAVPQDKDASTLVGINVNKIITLTFAIGSGLAAVAALMYCSTYPRVTTDMGSMMGMKAFIAAVLGGIGIIPGAMIGGILVGLIEIFVKLFAPGWYEAVTYGTLIVILLVKPAGILGKNTGEKV